MLIKSNNITCPKCNTGISVINHNSEVFVCSSCNKIFYKDSTRLKVDFEPELAHKIRCRLLEIGEKLQYNNVEYTLTGKLVKHEAVDNSSFWTEYCFSCEGQKSIVLSESSGHWNITEQTENIIDSVTGNIKYGIKYQDKYLKRFHDYIIKLAYAEGEFDADVIADIGSIAIEFCEPPTTLIIETNKKGIKSTYVSTYLFHSQVEKLMGRNIERIARVEYSGGQPFYFNFKFNSFLNAGIFLIVLFASITFLIGKLYPTVEIIKNKNISYGALDSNMQNIIEEIEIPYDHCIMSVTLDCYNLENDWIGADLDLINDSTNDHRYCYIETSKYSGYDDEGSWQSGGLTNDGNVENVEKGKYHLEITPLNIRGSTTRLKVANLTIKVYKSSWYVFWLFAGIVVACILIFMYFQDKFDRKKWGEDDDE